MIWYDIGGVLERGISLPLSQSSHHTGEIENRSRGARKEMA